MAHRRKATKPETHHEVMRAVADATGELVFVSPSIGWVIGESAQTLTGKSVHNVIEVVAALDAKPDAPKQNHLSASGFYDVALLRRDRDPLIVQARLDWVTSADGKPYTVIWLDPDCRLRKQKQTDYAHAAQEFVSFISENEKRAAHVQTAPAVHADISTDEGELRHFLNLTSDILAVYGRDMSFVRVNPAFNRVLGFSDADLKLFPFIDLVHPEQKDHILQLLQKIIHAPKGEEIRVDFECRTRCKDGLFRWIDWVVKGAVDGMVYVVGRDVTDIKQHESELHRRELQLSEAQKIGRMGHWYMDVSGSVMEWSDQIFTIFGVDKREFTPSVDSVSAMLMKRDLGRIYRAFQRAIIRKRDYELEFAIRTPARGVRFVRCEGRCKTDPRTGKTVALFGIMQDISERTLHEKSLREAKDAAETAYASKTRFLANMSHELRTPLNAIIGFSEMIQRQLLGPVGNPRYLEYIAGIRQSGEHLLDLINDILDMSKIEIGKYELYVEELNVGKVIRLAVHMVEGRAHESQVKMRSEDIPADIQIMADRRAIMQILLNLMSNAVKFTNPGGVVEVRCFRELGGIAIVVSDTGIGIPKDKIDVVTLPFEQVGSEFTRNHDGSGLGLAITKDLVEMHGGTLDIDSEVGVGTVVTVLLPDKIPDSVVARQQDKAEEAAAARGLRDKTG